MGGSNETTINRLRLHVNNGQVHVHDDSRSLKFEGAASDFKSQVKDAFEDLKKDDGIIKVTGIKDDLYIMRHDDKLTMFLSDKNDVESDLKTFLKNC